MSAIFVLEVFESMNLFGCIPQNVMCLDKNKIIFFCFLSTQSEQRFKSTKPETTGVQFKDINIPNVHSLKIQSEKLLKSKLRLTQKNNKLKTLCLAYALIEVRLILKKITAARPNLAICLAIIAHGRKKRQSNWSPWPLFIIIPWHYSLSLVMTKLSTARTVIAGGMKRIFQASRFLFFFRQSLRLLLSARLCQSSSQRKMSSYQNRFPC